MLIRSFAGVVLGAGLTLVGVWLAPSTDEDVAPAPTTTTTATPWIEPGETVIGNAVVIGRELRPDGTNGARFDYDVEPLTFGSAFTEGLAETAVLSTVPSAFSAVLSSGTRVDAALASPQARSVGFDLPTGTTVADIVEVRVTQWRTRLPLDLEVRFPSEVGAGATLPDGTVITLDTILEQNNGTVLQFDYTIPPGYWRDRQGWFGRTADFVGAGDGWRLDTATLGLTSGFQLLWAGSTAPAEIRIGVHLAPWHAVSADLPVAIAGRASS